MMAIRSTRRDAVLLHIERSEGDAVADPHTENLNPSIRSLASASMEDLDLVIGELQRVRDMLRNEGLRLNRVIARYAGTNQSLLATMKVIRENIKPTRSADLLCMEDRSPPFEHI